MHRVLMPFEFLEPASPAEAAELVDGERARVLAGGVDLVLKMRLRQIVPDKVISLQKVAELCYVREDEGGLSIGALATLRQVERAPSVKTGWPLLQEAIGSIASVQTKVMGTLVGNLCVASPASDVAVALCAVDARLTIAGVNRTRDVPIVDFFQGAGRTAVEPHEIVTDVFVPRPRPGSGAAFIKLAKTSEDVAKVNAAVVVEITDGMCTDSRIVLGAVGATPLRAIEAERLLEGRELGGVAGGVTQALSSAGPASCGEAISAAAAVAMDAATPISDVRSNATYRREMVRVLVRDALERAVSRALGEGRPR